MDFAQFWSVLGHISSILAVGGGLIALSVFLYWRWLNHRSGWWVWNVYLWPKAVTYPYIQTGSGKPLSLVISIRMAVVNASVIPDVIQNVRLSLTHEGSGRQFEYEPDKIMKADAFTRNADLTWQPHEEEFFHPFMVAARSDAVYHFLFLPTDLHAMMEEPEAGKYQGELVLERAHGSPHRFALTFKLTESEATGFRESKGPLLLIHGRQIVVDKSVRPRPVRRPALANSR